MRNECDLYHFFIDKVLIVYCAYYTCNFKICVCGVHWNLISNGGELLYSETIDIDDTKQNKNVIFNNHYLKKNFENFCYPIYSATTYGISIREKFILKCCLIKNKNV